MVQLSPLVGLYFVTYNKDYNNTTNNNIHIYDKTAYIVDPMEKWGDLFLPIHDMWYKNSVRLVIMGHVPFKFKI